MIRRVTRLVLLLVIGVNLTVLAKYENYSQVLDQLCPFARVCYSGDKEPKDWIIDSLPENLRSCCLACSCEESCETNGDCCFGGEAKELEESEQCINSFLGNRNAVDNQQIPGFSMIVNGPEDDCYTDICPSSYKIYGVKCPCSEAEVSPWGSLYPVYSNASGNIYINSICAMCHNETDLVTWSAVLICDKNNFTDSTLITFKENNEIPDRCYLLFTYPGDDTNIADKECFDEVVNNCLTDAFNIPVGLHMSKPDIIYNCVNGLYAPFLSDMVYKNVFCKICSGTDLGPPLCRKYNSVERGIGLETTLAVLLDTTDLEPNAYSLEHDFYSPLACTVIFYLTSKTVFCMLQMAVSTLNLQKKGDFCKPVLCPLGKVRDEDGLCKNVEIPKAYRTFLLSVRLLPSNQFESIPAQMLDRVSDTAEEWWIYPFHEQWKINRILFKETDNETVSYFVIVLTLQTDQSPGNVIESVKTRLSEYWFVKAEIDGEEELCALRQELLPHKEMKIVHVDETDGRISMKAVPSWWTGSSFSTSVYFPEAAELNVLQDDNLREHSYIHFMITKQHFCNMILLHDDEFILYDNDLILYHNTSDRFLFDGEFSLTIDDSGYKKAKVCIDGTGFDELVRQTNNLSLMFNIPLQVILLSHVFVNIVSIL